MAVAARLALRDKDRVNEGGMIAGDDAPLLPVEPGYRNVLRVRTLILWLTLTAGALAFDRIALAETRLAWVIPGLFAILTAAAVAILPNRTYRRLRYRLTERLLQVMRGWMVHSDTVVPLVRVQHFDVVRGPLEKMFGTATLVVHTAGTLNSTVTVPGLAPERAAEIRDVIREHVRTDFE
jgi:membrane protein YdbS with pleckstrin-like domain